MKLLQTSGWNDYELLDSGDGKRLERFGKYLLIRPDPQCIWEPHREKTAWEKADAVFRKSESGKEEWVRNTEVPHKWLMQYNGLSFYAKLSPFKHTGVFPEQHLMWDFICDKIAKGIELRAKGAEANDKGPRTKDQFNVLNLFGYTGIASLAAAKAGAKVTHVDASYPTIGWAKENQEAAGLSEKPIRWILDDCTKFVKRELKRGVRYDGIIMDPPVFGHGPEGERWEFFDSFPELLDLCRQVLTEQPLFVVINAYAISASSIMLENVLQDTLKAYRGEVEAGELALQEKDSGRLLSTGIFARWTATQ
jgi:23S rRNA (cytosine1962-C5)-methyltransferase